MPTECLYLLLAVNIVWFILSGLSDTEVQMRVMVHVFIGVKLYLLQMSETH